MKRLHQMPFGATPVNNGTHFRLWAPAAQRVDLRLLNADAEEFLPMVPLTGGWFEVVAKNVGAGNRYHYRIDRKLNVPDPASRYNPDDVHAPSQVVDPSTYQWTDDKWQGKPWESAVIYEIHTGTFTSAGTFGAIVERLDYLVALGITAIELMPIADFPGQRNWGYDGVLQFAPDSSYGNPDDLKFLIDSAHQKGLMVFLDVVYNHFGPEGNYLHAYAPQFFTERHHTPWGAAINFDGEYNRTVRDFFIHNACYWLEEFHFDGLRFDAVHAIIDDSDKPFLTELAEIVRAKFGPDRHIHLVLENDDNATRYLERNHNNQPCFYSAQWNDDIHHVMHVIASGESNGYYADYAEQPIANLLRCLTQGFNYQGEESVFRNKQPRGEPSAHLSSMAFVSFTQNHDQIGNRAFGERLSALADERVLRALSAITLLAPPPPLLFMGEEFAASQPFQFFCDFSNDLADAVREGRRKEFSAFLDQASREKIPDPNALETFLRSKLDWQQITMPPHDAWLTHYVKLLTLRRQAVMPRLSGMQGGKTEGQLIGQHGMFVQWCLGDSSTLTLIANLGETALTDVDLPKGDKIYVTDENFSAGVLPPWFAGWFLSTPKENTLHLVNKKQ